MSKLEEPEQIPEKQPEAKDIARKLQPFLKPEKMEQGVRAVSMLLSKTHIGPLPAPEDFAHYEEILPGLADRITCMSENEQSHRHRLESRGMMMEFSARILGQITALAVGLAAFATVCFCAYYKQPITAAILTAIGGITVGFLGYAGRKRAEKTKPEPAKPPARRPRRK